MFLRCFLWYDIIKLSIQRQDLRGKKMKRLTAKQRRFLIHKSKKEMFRRSKLKKTHRGYNSQVSRSSEMIDSGSISAEKLIPKRREKRLTAPNRFSLFQNVEETVRYFVDVHNTVEACVPGDRVYFDLSEVDEISADAVMYVIALLHNEKQLQRTDIHCGGNEPRSIEAQKIINDVGFFQYVESKTFHPTNQASKVIRISRGHKLDEPLAAKICEFVHEQTNNSIGRIGTKRLYAMLIELMNNTYQHAYADEIDENSSYCNWYLYAEDKEDTVQFIFLDTGLGIPKTIRRSIWEKTVELFRDNDARYIASALRGEYRTETKEDHRGKGLPEIYDCVKDKAINTLRILSGQGLCIVRQDGSIQEQSIDSEFQGTMFMWSILKER